jgi:hypothetical protein
MEDERTKLNDPARGKVTHTTVNLIEKKVDI